VSAFWAGKAFDCRFLITDQRLELGGNYEVPIKFLSPELVLPKLSVEGANHRRTIQHPRKDHVHFRRLQPSAFDLQV
jgi:hypothetical protein